MTFNLINNRLISLMLIVCIVFLCFALTVAPADALVTEVLLTGACASNPLVALAVAGTILVGAGLVFDSEATLETMAAALINNNPVINNLIGGFDVMAAASAEFFDFNLTQAAVDELGGWLDGLFTASSGNNGSVYISPVTAVSVGDTLSTIPISSINSFSSLPRDFWESDVNQYYSQITNDTYFCLLYDSGSYRFYFKDVPTTASYPVYTRYISSSAVNLSVVCTAINSDSYTYTVYSDTAQVYSSTIPFTVSAYNFNPDLVVPSATAAADSTFFPQSLDNDKKLTPGIPLTVPEGLSNLVDLPVEGVRNVSTDIPQTDVSSGTITGDGTGTGIFEGIGNWILNIPGIGAIARTISSIWDWLQSLFDVSQFSLDFSVLKSGLTSVFPFSIPFDFYNAVSMFSSAARDFSFDIDLETIYFEIHHTVDLSPFRIPFTFFRYIVVFWFGFILVSRTRDWIKW